MTAMNARLLVIGAGVNGSMCAAGLAEAGFDVTLLARGQRLRDLQAGGIIIEDQFKYTRSVTHVPLIERLAPDDRYDYILVVVRKNQVAELLPALAGNASPNVVFMVNNPSGPRDYVRAIGKERVMLGFVFGAGRREKSVIRGFVPRQGRVTTPFGEIDGAITPRLTRLVEILREAGFSAGVSRRIVDWQATHAALVVPIALLIMKHTLDTRAMARSTQDLRQMIDAMRETLDVLRANGYKITPAATEVIRIIPRFLLVALLRLALPTRVMEVGAVWHCSQAPDEMHQLASELEALVARTNLRAPALRAMLGMGSPAPLRTARHPM